MKKRLVVKFPEKASKLVRELAKHQSMSCPEVLRRAMALYNFVIKEVRCGNKITISDKQDRILKELVMDIKK